MRNPTPKGVVGFVIACAVIDVIDSVNDVTCGFRPTRE